MKKRAIAALLTGALLFQNFTVAFAAEDKVAAEPQEIVSEENNVPAEPESDGLIVNNTTEEYDVSQSENAGEETESLDNETDGIETNDLKDNLQDIAVDSVTVPESEEESEPEVPVNTETSAAPQETDEEILLDAPSAGNTVYSAWFDGNTIEIYTNPLDNESNLSYSYEIYDAADNTEDKAETEEGNLLTQGTVTAQGLQNNSVHFLSVAMDKNIVKDKMQIVFSSGESEKAEAFISTIPAVTSLKAAVENNGEIRLNWEGNLDSASGWEVSLFEKDKLDKSVSTVVTKDKTSVLTGLKANVLYTVVVNGIIEEKDGEGVSERVFRGSKAVLDDLNVSAPKLSVSNGTESIVLSWTKVAGAVSYDIYRSAKGKNAWSKINSVSGLSYTDKNLKIGAGYDYKVQAAGQSFTGSFSNVVTRTVVAVPGRPTRLKAVSGECMITLSWQKAEGVSGYKVFYYDTAANKVGSSIGTTTGTTYAVKGLRGNKTYSFFVRAYNKSNDGSILYGAGSGAVSAKTTFKAPGGIAGLKATAEDHGVRLTWNAAKNATSYDIFEYNSSKKTIGKKVGDTKSTSYLAGDLEPGKTYTFVVRSNRTVNGSSGWGPVSAAVSAKALNLVPGTATGLTAKGGDKEVILTWKAAPNVFGYMIFQKNLETGEYKYIDTTKKTTYTVAGLTNKQKYTFRIRTYRRWGVKEVHTVYGGFTGDVSAIPTFSGKVSAPASLNVVNSSSGNKLTWAAVKNATGYIIYRYNFSTAKYEQVAKVGNVRTWNDASIKTTKGKFKYKVCAYRIEEGKTYTSAGIEKLAFGATDIKAIDSKVHAIYYRARVNRGTRLYNKAGNKVGTISAGERVTVQYRSSRTKVQRSNGDVVYMSPHALDLLSEIYTGKDYSTDEKELFVNMKGYTSSSKYLIWISTYTQRVNIFTGSKGQWKLFRACRCATGDKETPTPLGGFKLYARQSAQKYKHTYYRYLSKFFIKNSMHTRIRYYSGRFEDSRLGLPLSHGCVRLEDQNAKYIYQNVPLKTTVIVY